MTTLRKHLLQSLSLWSGTWETVEDYTSVILTEAIVYTCEDVNHQLVTESVADEVEVTLRLAGAPADEWPERRAAILESVDLVGYEDRHPMALSGGQKQRLAVGTALASGREIVILDEPTSGLDVAHMEQVVDVMRTLRDAGKTVIVVTHDRHLIEAAADHVIEMYPPAA